MDALARDFELLDQINNFPMCDEFEDIPRRHVRDAENPIELYSDEEFRLRYRFNKNTVVVVILPLVVQQFKKHTNRGLPYPPTICLLIALRFYATGNFQILCTDIPGMSQATVSRIVKNVSVYIASHSRTLIKFPNELQRVQEEFYNIASFRRVIGCIDCTHVAIKNPGGELAEVFRNKKQSFSLNVQIVCGPNLEIFDIVARWPGREEDWMIFNKSSLKVRFERNELTGLLLGDSEYTCLPNLLTPLLKPHTIPQQRYNRAHFKTRNTVEKLFGVWKRRFSCLQRGLANKIDTVPAIIVACAVLHNIAITAKDYYVECHGDELRNEENDIEKHLPQTEQLVGHAIRNHIVETQFS